MGQIQFNDTIINLQTHNLQTDDDLNSIKFIDVHEDTINYSTANTWKYTSLYADIPAYCMFGINGTITYDKQKPVAVKFSSSGIDSEDWRNIAYSTGSKTSLCGITVVQNSFYLWGKWELSGTPQHATIRGWYKKYL